MIKSIEELKQFILWAKEQEIKSLKVGEVEIHISDIYFANRLMNPPSDSLPEHKPSSKRFIDDDQADEDDDDLLYYSSGT